MAGQGAPQPGAPESAADLTADSEADVADEMDVAEDEREAAVEAPALADGGSAETHRAAAVIVNDLEQFSGSQAHPTEPVTRPAEPASPAETTHAAQAERSDATELSSSQPPDKTDPDTQ
jgi:hypothetical protein